MSNVSDANQHTNDSREQACWDLFVASITAGEENAYKAAIEAGYSHDHSRNITLQGWFKERSENLVRLQMLSKAERNLGKMLDANWESSKEGDIHPEVMRIVADVSKTVATRIGKDKGWAERQELTGKGGKDLPTPIFGNYVPNDDGHEEGGGNA